MKATFFSKIVGLDCVRIILLLYLNLNIYLNVSLRYVSTTYPTIYRTCLGGFLDALNLNTYFDIKGHNHKKRNT